MSDSHERPTNLSPRRPYRVEAHNVIRVEIGFAGEPRSVEGWVHSANLNGMSMICDRTLPKDAEVSFRLTLVEENRTVEGKGWVVRPTDDGMAIQFDDLPLEKALPFILFLDRNTPPAHTDDADAA
ncbi:MAG: hypothetical protein ACE5FN_11580 [Leptospirillia bacterium]